VKHSRDYSANEHPELSEYLLDSRPPLEAQLIDLADEIAYTTADLDDGYEAHLLSLDKVGSEVQIFARYLPEVERVYPQAIDKLKFNETLKRVLNRLVDDLIRNTRARVQAGQIKTLEDVRRYKERLVAFSPEADAERRQAKEFLYANLYFSSALEGEKEDAERVITDLFEFWTLRPEALPRSYQERARTVALPQIICEYIAGMTDNFIYEQHQKYCTHAKLA
jgi:dGTPase